MCSIAATAALSQIGRHISVPTSKSANLCFYYFIYPKIHIILKDDWLPKQDLIDMCHAINSLFTVQFLFILVAAVFFFLFCLLRRTAMWCVCTLVDGIKPMLLLFSHSFSHFFFFFFFWMKYFFFNFRTANTLPTNNKAERCVYTVVHAFSSGCGQTSSTAYDQVTL